MSSRITAAVRGSFASATIRNRWPKILTKVIDTTYRQRHRLIAKHGTSGGDDITAVVDELCEIRNHISADKQLQLLSDKCADVNVYNNGINRLKSLYGDENATWFKSPWLFSECYMYRRIIGAIAKSQYFHDFDPYAVQKETAFVNSLPFTKIVADHLHAIVNSNTTLSESDRMKTVLTLLQVYFQPPYMIICNVSLWGNKADLSVTGGDRYVHPETSPLTQVTDLRDFILVDDLSAVYSMLTKLTGRSRRIDIILDNGGLELFGDLCLAEFLISAKLVDTVVFHGKTIPWFVSDTTGPDFVWTTEMLRLRHEDSFAMFGHRWHDRLESVLVILQTIFNKISKYYFADWAYYYQRKVSYTFQGQFEFRTHPFWTYPHAFCEMHTYAPDLYNDFAAESQLLIFKGDLNYRKLVGDRQWPIDTPFRVALDGFTPAPLLSLRTLKAEVVVGLSSATIDRIRQRFGTDRQWMVNGEYSVIQFEPEGAAKTLKL